MIIVPFRNLERERERLRGEEREREEKMECRQTGGDGV